MTSAELLEEITTQLGELEPRHVMQLRARINRLAGMLEREERVRLQGWEAAVEDRRRQLAGSIVIARVQEAGQ